MHWKTLHVISIWLFFSLLGFQLFWFFIFSFGFPVAWQLDSDLHVFLISIPCILSCFTWFHRLILKILLWKGLCEVDVCKISRIIRTELSNVRNIGFFSPFIEDLIFDLLFFLCTHANIKALAVMTWWAMLIIWLLLFYSLDFLGEEACTKQIHLKCSLGCRKNRISKKILSWFMVVHFFCNINLPFNSWIRDSNFSHSYS